MIVKRVLKYIYGKFWKDYFRKEFIYFIPDSLVLFKDRKEMSIRWNLLCLTTFVTYWIIWTKTTVRKLFRISTGSSILAVILECIVFLSDHERSWLAKASKGLSRTTPRGIEQSRFRYDSLLLSHRTINLIFSGNVISIMRNRLLKSYNTSVNFVQSSNYLFTG